MKKLFIAILFVGLAVGTAQGVTSNPEAFETYALTDDFEEMSIGDGGAWYTGWFRFEVTGGLGIWEIIDDSPGNATQVYKHDNTTGWDTKSRWWGKVTDDLQVLQYDVMLAEESGYNRSMVSMGDYIDNWQYTGMTMLKKTDSVTEAILYSGGIDPLGDEAVVPGQSSVDYGVWYTVEMETNRASNEVRARFGPTGGTMNDWTGWIEYDPTHDVGANFHSHGFSSTGEVHYDNISVGPVGGDCNPGDANNDDVVSADDYGSVQLNFSDTGLAGIPGDANCDGVVSADDYGSVQLNFGTVYGAGGVPVPEPATLALLSAGSLLLLKRKRKS